MYILMNKDTCFLIIPARKNVLDHCYAKLHRRRVHVATHLHNKQALEVGSNGRYRLLRKNSKITRVVPEDNKTSYFCLQLQSTTKIVRYELQALAASLEVSKDSSNAN